MKSWLFTLHCPLCYRSCQYNKQGPQLEIRKQQTIDFVSQQKVAICWTAQNNMPKARTSGAMLTYCRGRGQINCRPLHPLSSRCRLIFDLVCNHSTRNVSLCLNTPLGSQDGKMDSLSSLHWWDRRWHCGPQTLRQATRSYCGRWTHNQTLRSCVMQNVLIFMREHRQLVSALCLFSIHWELGRVGQDGDSQCHPHWAPCWLFRNLWVMSLWFWSTILCRKCFASKGQIGTTI